MTAPATRLGELLAAWRRRPDPGSAGGLLAAAEELLARDDGDGPGRDLWLAYLDLTRHPDFLCALPDSAARLRWAETTFAVVARTRFDLGDLMAQRTAALPDRILFRELDDPGAGGWTYAQVQRRLRSTAALFLKEGRGDPGDRGFADDDEIRIGLLGENGIGLACADLACLTSDLFVAPLNLHFSTPNLVWIFDRLRLTAAVCDTADNLEKLLAVREQTARGFSVFMLNDCLRTGADGIQLLEERRALLDGAEVEALLAARPRRPLRAPATVMFTSGSTGMPKGVAFSQFNLVSKRFARAAALPEVGRDETMLCYLPLFHTFGRYLEMLGMIFWGGTYVFAGNPSAETLLAQFQEVRPTALISVPVRWVQIMDRVLAEAGAAAPDSPEADAGAAFRRLVGDRLYWGLSAAGYLAPRVFRWFQGMGVALCSGFGMTEGTGGLTMTPPGDYQENSVGIPLPGVRIRFSEQGELQIAGPYIARYLPAEGAPGDLAVPEPESDEHWLATGDLFRETGRGHLEIIDRIKDIYKNDRGQTIAPRKVEALFDGVPGIKRTFLAGDGRAFNTLLIVPDDADEVLQSLTDEDDRRQYFRRIVTTANPELAPFERVVNFALLHRDFSQALGELTAKGSYRRKEIEKNFAPVIKDLYQSNSRVLTVGGLSVRIPRWFFRDLGVLENGIEAVDGALVNGENGRRLTVTPGAEGRVRIGDLEYRLQGTTIDLGLMARQPLLWLANPQVEAFCPCKYGWDTDLGPFEEQVYLPPRGEEPTPPLTREVHVDRQVEETNHLCNLALYGTAAQSEAAIVELDHQLEHVGNRQGTVIRRRLEALANHPEQSVRCRAYQVLVLDQPVPDYLRYLPSFIESGKPFLDDKSFQAISRARIEPRRLQALRQRLHSYRDQLAWPADDRTRRLFADLFHLLADFGRYHPEFYGTIREELVSWIMHEADEQLAAAARREFNGLAEWFEERLRATCNDLDPAAWEGKISFQDGLGHNEIYRLQRVLIGTTFLRESILLAFEGEDLALSDIAPGGIWVSRIISRYEDSRYRVSVNTRSGKHFDLQLIIRLDIDQSLVLETIYWYITLRGYPFGTPMLPSFGCCRPELGALSMAYVSGLTVWEKIREFSSVRGPGTTPPSRLRWHQLMVRALTVVIKGWRNSGRRIVPGLITPNNIVVPEPDFRQGAIQNNLSGWKPYSGPLSLFQPLWRNLYQHTVSHYPWTAEYLDRRWFFEAFVEALDVPEARRWLGDLLAALPPAADAEYGAGFRDDLAAYCAELDTRYYRPLALHSAIARYEEWERAGAMSPAKARLEVLEDLVRLYRLDRLPPLARFTLFRHTYFRDADLHLLDIFDRLLVRMFRHPERRVTQMVELSDLQAALGDPDDRLTFNRLVFPHRRRDAQVEVRTVGDPERHRVIVRSTISDRFGNSYQVGQPAGPAEVGHLYRLFLQAGFPKTISEADQYFIATDAAEQIVGGVIYRLQDDGVAFLDGIVVTQALLERGIAGAMLEDFCTRMKALGNPTVKTHFFLRRFYQGHGFRMDQRLGGLVRFL